METDPHDDYYARKQAHREEMLAWCHPLSHGISRTLKKALILVAALAVTTAAAS